MPLTMSSPTPRAKGGTEQVCSFVTFLYGRLPLDPLYKILSILKIEIKSQILYLHAHSILYTQNNITLTVLKAHTQSEILPQLGKFYTTTAYDACDK